jgi:hypothetical protein
MNKENENAAHEMDAIDLLTSDHHEVEKFFKQYKKLTHQDANTEQHRATPGTGRKNMPGFECACPNRRRDILSRPARSFG